MSRHGLLIREGFNNSPLSFEVWKIIPDFENYFISSFGRVKNKKGKILSPNVNGAGYLFVGLYRDGKRFYRQIHGLVAKSFLIPRPSEKHQVNHKDGNKKNPYFKNLEWMTPKENMEHAVKNGLLVVKSGNENHLFGKKQSKNHIIKRSISKGKLSENDVLKIKKMLKDNKPCKEIGILFGVSFYTIKDIKNGRTWKWIGMV